MSHQFDPRSEHQSLHVESDPKAGARDRLRENWMSGPLTHSVIRGHYDVPVFKVRTVLWEQTNTIEVTITKC